MLKEFQIHNALAYTDQNRGAHLFCYRSKKFLLTAMSWPDMDNTFLNTLTEANDL